MQVKNFISISSISFYIELAQVFFLIVSYT